MAKDAGGAEAQLAQGDICLPELWGVPAPRWLPREENQADLGLLCACDVAEAVLRGQGHRPPCVWNLLSLGGLAPLETTGLLSLSLQGSCQEAPDSLLVTCLWSRLSGEERRKSAEARKRGPCFWSAQQDGPVWGPRVEGTRCRAWLWCTGGVARCSALGTAWSSLWSPDDWILDTGTAPGEAFGGQSPEDVVSSPLLRMEPSVEKKRPHPGWPDSLGKEAARASGGGWPPLGLPSPRRGPGGAEKRGLLRAERNRQTDSLGLLLASPNPEFPLLRGRTTGPSAEAAVSQRTGPGKPAQVRRPLCWTASGKSKSGHLQLPRLPLRHGSHQLSRPCRDDTK
ncbi:uncharacterized protein [Castor canadensis]|uniref:Uncharacterized protein n=1 Tax=Castor canadensis TaxID=51338 RepID=A0AC58LJS7_CASCN